jgi:glutamate--cysteine ligase
VLIKDGGRVPLADWARDIFDGLEPICAILDEDAPVPHYANALRHQRDMLRDPEQLPSARILRDLREQRMSFFDYTLRLAYEHEAWFRAHPLRSGLRDHFRGLAEKSIAEQRALEGNDQVDFATYLAQQAIPLQENFTGA